MGFLDHSTNNIIVDAVLTDAGRKALARNDGSFQVHQFALGDDEVDYSILEQYGLITGKEKIEKNTPVFEAITDQSIALKYPLRTFTSNNTNDIFAFPFLKLEDKMVTPIALSSNSSSVPGAKSKNISFKTFINQDENFTLTENLLKDTEFEIKVFNKLLKLSNNTPYDTKSNDIDCYRISGTRDTDIEEFSGQIFGSFTVTPIGVVNNSTFKYYATTSSPSLIKTQIEITGLNSKASLIVPVTITSSQL